MEAMREQIINRVVETFQNRDEVFALWLEGSDGLGRVDEYSDLDIWMDVADGHETAVMEECVAALGQLAPLTMLERYDHPHPQIFQYNMHLAGTSPYLIIDLCVQSHSRDRQATAFVRDDVAEQPRVLFDKAGIITLVEPPPPDTVALWAICQRARDRFAQRSRMEKYLHRGKYLEAYAYYHRYVCEPVVEVLRALYTPRHWDYGYVHISDHLPPEDVAALTRLNQVSTLQDMAQNLPLADEVFTRAAARLEAMLGRA